MGLRKPTGEPVEGRLVGVIPTKTPVGGRASRKGALVACVIGSCFKSSLFAFCAWSLSLPRSSVEASLSCSAFCGPEVPALGVREGALWIFRYYEVVFFSRTSLEGTSVGLGCRFGGCGALLWYAPSLVAFSSTTSYRGKTDHDRGCGSRAPVVPLRIQQMVFRSPLER